jgi:hypothetical protein
MNPKKETDVKISIIEVIHAAAKPVGYRLDSLLRDYYKDELELSAMEFTLLMEMRTASTTLSCLLEEYLEQAREHNVEKITLPNSEFKLIIDLSKTVELAQRTRVGIAALWVS